MKNSKFDLDLKYGQEREKKVAVFIIDQQIINHPNIYASNSNDNPNEIVPKKTNIVTFQNKNLIAKIPKLSYLFILLKIK